MLWDQQFRETIKELPSSKFFYFQEIKSLPSIASLSTKDNNSQVHTQKLSNRFGAWRYSFGIKEKVHALLSFLVFREDGERCEADANNDNARSLSSSAETRALLLRAMAKTLVYKHTRTETRVRCETIESALRERWSGSSDRAEYRYTCVHRPRSSPGPPWPPRAPLSVYIEIALRPNRTHAFAFHRWRSRGKPSPILLPLPARPAGPDLCGLPVLPRARFKISRQPKNRVRAHRRHKTRRNSVKTWSKRRLFRDLCKNCSELAKIAEKWKYIIKIYITET